MVMPSMVKDVLVMVDSPDFNAELSQAFIAV
jgi:hypothetical protein